MMPLTAELTDFTGVPADLQNSNRILQKIHAVKAAAVVRGCVPFSRILHAPRAAAPGILMYHRVVPTQRLLPSGYQAPTWNVTPERFHSQLSGLLNSGYSAWSLSQLLDAWKSGNTVSENVFVVTFDDGYANNLRYALPVLKELNIPATIFLATAYLGSPNPFPFDDWKLKGKPNVHSDCWRVLSIRECETCLDSGLIEFGSHTHTHEDFRGRPNAFEASLQLSMEALEQRFGILHPTLSLPYGIIGQGFAGPEYFEIAERAGTRCCLTTEEELLQPDQSPFGWGRFIAEQHDSFGTLGVKLDGWRDLAREMWRHARRKSGATRNRNTQ